MTLGKYVLVLATVLMVGLACSSTPVTEERVIAATATSVVNLETESPATLHPIATPRPTPTPRPTATPRPTPTPRPWPFSESDGGWFSEVETDPLTDQEKILAAIRPRDSKTSDDNWLIVRCGYQEDEDVQVVVSFDKEFEDGFFIEVQYRFDEGTVEIEQWSISTTNTALFSQLPVEFIWQTMNSSKIAMREEGGKTLIFDVDGLANVLYPHRDKCDWIGVGAVSKKINRPTPTATARPRSTQRPTASPVAVDGAPLPREFTGGEEIAATASTTDMVAVGADGLSGTLHLIQIGRETKFTVTLDSAGPYAAAIRRGGCPDRGAEPSGQFDYILFNIVDGKSISIVSTPAQFFQFSLAYVVVVDGTDVENDALISCGNIPSPLR